MANPRKFSEKIALHNQKQAEETAAFERIMQECTVTRVMGAPQPRTVTQLQPHPQAFLRPYLSGSLPNVNQISASPHNMELHHQSGFDESKHTMRQPGRFDSRMRPYAYTNRRHGMPFELNRHRVNHVDGQPNQYPGAYLSPPPESNWRSIALSRTNSDSALHQSVMNPNPQQHFNPNSQMHHQGLRDANETNFNMNPPYHNAILESKRFEQQLQNASRSKSCEAPNISLLPSGTDTTSAMLPGANGTTVPLGGTGTVSSIDPSLNRSLSHVTQIGNNTGSLPNLPALFNHPTASHDYNDQHPSCHAAGSNPPLYHQAQAHSAANLPAASSVTPHLAGFSRNPASPNRPRRTTVNGPSPLSMSSPDHARRMKFPSNTSPKVGIKTELKSPPIGGPYSYSHPGQPGAWPLSTDHPGSPSHVQPMGQNPAQPMQHHLSHQPAGNLRIDVSAATKISQQPPSYPRPHQGVSVTSPLTSPTSPTSQCGQFSPVTSPPTDFNPASNPTHSDPYYNRSDVSSIQPLQRQLERIHMMNDSGPSGRGSGAPSTCGMLSTLNENSLDSLYEQDQGRLSHNVTSLQSAKLGAGQNHANEIPHIVFTGADGQHANKSSANMQSFGMMSGHELGAGDYFSADNLRATLGIEELRMLEETNIIADPVMEDNLHLEHI